MVSEVPVIAASTLLGALVVSLTSALGITMPPDHFLIMVALGGLFGFVGHFAAPKKRRRFWLMAIALGAVAAVFVMLAAGVVWNGAGVQLVALAASLLSDPVVRAIFGALNQAADRAPELGDGVVNKAAQVISSKEKADD